MEASEQPRPMDVDENEDENENASCQGNNEDEEVASELSNESGAQQESLQLQRYKRLQHLLQKSSVYSEFMLKQIERQKEEEKTKSSRKERRKKQVDNLLKEHGMATRGKGKSLSSAAEKFYGKPKQQTTRKTRKRALNSSYNVSDFIDEQGCLIKMDTTDESAPRSLGRDGTRKEDTSFWRISDGQLVSHRQPRLVTGGVLRDYQLDGLDWLRVLYENGVNGILADEMGLGKTIQCIGLIATMIENNVCGPFLIVCPLSTVTNWVGEFSKFAPTIPVVLYHGSIKEREDLRRKHLTTNKKRVPELSYPVIITSYEISMRDQRHLQNRPWKYLIVDEGHRIKNLNCKLIKDLKAYNAGNRLLLTGTPLQNNLAELWSLLNFLLPDIFDDLNCFEAWFDFSNGDCTSQIVSQEREHHVLSMLHQILSPFLLRRLKTDVEYNLPPKKEIMVYAPLASKQAEYYKATLERSIFELIAVNKKKEEDDTTIDGETPMDVKRYPARRSSEKAKKRLKFDCDDEKIDAMINGELDWQTVFADEDEPEVVKKKTSILNIRMQNRMMQLRKCVNHPYLLEFPLTSDGDFKIDEDIVANSGKMMLLDRMLPALLRDGHKVLIFSQMTHMMDILEDYLELRNLFYSRLDGTMSFSVRQEQIKQFQEDPEVNVFLLSTRAGGLGINLTAADTVIIYDSDWNPQQDLQAQDRCHRIGQTKPVIVYRYVTINTIDQRVVEIAAGKRKLEKMVMHKGKFKTGRLEEGNDAITADKLYELLLQSDHDKVVNTELMSDEILEALLDREVCKKPTLPEGDIQDTPSENDEANKNFFQVLEETDRPARDLQGINSENATNESVTNNNNTSSS